MTAPAPPRWWNIDQSKLSRYLLDPTHADGGPKAKFLMGYGFTTADEIALADALFQHPYDGVFLRETMSPRGDLKYIYRGALLTPDRRNPIVRTVWRIAEGSARFVTLVPKA